MSNRGLAIALFLSMALNLFAVGAVVGGFVIAHRIHQTVPGLMAGRPGMPQQPLWAAADGLPPAHRDAYRAILRSQALGVAQQVRAARLARRQAWAGLTTEPFDAAAAGKALAEARMLEMQARGGVEQKIVDFAATLPPPERAQLAQGLARSAPGVRMMRRMHGEPDGPPPPQP